MAATSIVNRAARRHYMNIATADAPEWSLIGEGFTDFTESKNAVSYQRRYIHESSKRTDVTGYAPTIDYEFEVYKGNPVIEKLRSITDYERTGEEAQVEICTVDLFDETGTSGVCSARRRVYSVIPDECGSGTDTLLYTGTLKSVSDGVSGSFVLSTAVFTEKV